MHPSPPTSLLYYITGHGFGHAQRSAEVIRIMLATKPDLHVHIRTAAPAFIFADLGSRAHYENVIIDRGCIEIDALTLDWPTTLRHVRSLLDGRDDLVAAEVDYIRKHNVGLIAADIPFMAGEVAHAASLPCWAVGNFTWDWIYQPYADADLVAEVCRGYEYMEGLLSIPFRHEMPQFKRVIDVPLIAARPRLTDYQSTRLIGVDISDHRPRILAAMRGGISQQTIERAARQSPDLLFYLWAHNGPTDAPNLFAIPTRSGLGFHDALQVMNVVVTKVGHGIITDCIANHLAILHPPRTGFREDDMLMRLAGQYLRHRPIDLAPFHEGDWSTDLHALLAHPAPTQTLPANGATVVAEALLSKIV